MIWIDHFHIRKSKQNKENENTGLVRVYLCVPIYFAIVRAEN
jgi:hypothetical protein